VCVSCILCPVSCVGVLVDVEEKGVVLEESRVLCPVSCEAVSVSCVPVSVSV
jgi:hypothetical protein